jgi:hypothetical protein
MGKRKTERRARTQDRVRNLDTAAVEPREAMRVVGGETNQVAAKPSKPDPYMRLTLENTMISNYSL